MRSSTLSLLLGVVVWQAACAPLGSGERTRCFSDAECPDSFSCDQESGFCVVRSGVVDASAVDVAMLDTAGTDSPQVDAATADATVSDLAAADLAATDLSAADISAPEASTPEASTPDSTVPDAGLPDSNVPDSAAPDSAAPDSAASDSAVSDSAVSDSNAQDSNAPDSATPDQGSGDSCAANAGEPCNAPDLCGSSYDCAGDCVGGTVAPGCPECGARSCVTGSGWGDCEGGSCGASSYCSVDGNCACIVNECSEPGCWDGDLFDCDIDPWGCGQLVLDEDCLADDCGGSPPSCGIVQSCGPFECTNEAGICVSGDLPSQCGYSGVSCQSCDDPDPCMLGECINGGCLSFFNDGGPCGDNRVCYLGQCCVANAGDTCWSECTECPCSIQGTVTCDGACLSFGDCFFICESC